MYSEGVDPLFELIAYDPIAVPSSDSELAAVEARFEQAWRESRSPTALVLALEGLEHDEQRRWIRDICFDLQSVNPLFAQLAELHRKSESGTLGVYNGPAFDRARGIAGRIGGWERFRASPDPAIRARILRDASDRIRSLQRSARPTYRAVLQERARWGTYPQYDAFRK